MVVPVDDAGFAPKALAPVPVFAVAPAAVPNADLPKADPPVPPVVDPKALCPNADPAEGAAVLLEPNADPVPVVLAPLLLLAG